VPRGAPSEAQWADAIRCRGSVGQRELAAEASRKAVWWGLRFASLLTHLLMLCWLLSVTCVICYYKTLNMCMLFTYERTSGNSFRVLK